MSRALSGQGVLVTRPRARAHGLCARLRARGARVVLLPTLTVEPIATPGLADYARAQLASADRIVFVSPAAVAEGLALFRRAAAERPPGARVAAVGRATGEALEAAGWVVDDQPGSGAGGEALLSNALTEVAGERVLIVRGVGGREALARTLTARGAQVAYLEVYRRVDSTADPGPALAGWQEGWLQFTIVTSASGLEALLRIVGPEGLQPLCRSRGITVSDRLAERMREVGFLDPPCLAADPSDLSITEAVVRAATEQRERP